MDIVVGPGGVVHWKTGKYTTQEIVDLPGPQQPEVPQYQPLPPPPQFEQSRFKRVLNRTREFLERQQQPQTVNLPGTNVPIVQKKISDEAPPPITYEKLSALVGSQLPYQSEMTPEGVESLKDIKRETLGDYIERDGKIIPKPTWKDVALPGYGYLANKLLYPDVAPSLADPTRAKDLYNIYTTEKEKEVARETSAEKINLVYGQMETVDKIDSTLQKDLEVYDSLSEEEQSQFAEEKNLMTRWKNYESNILQATGMNVNKLQEFQEGVVTPYTTEVESLTSPFREELKVEPSSAVAKYGLLEGAKAYTFTKAFYPLKFLPKIPKLKKFSPNLFGIPLAEYPVFRQVAKVSKIGRSIPQVVKIASVPTFIGGVSAIPGFVSVPSFTVGSTTIPEIKSEYKEYGLATAIAGTTGRAVGFGFLKSVDLGISKFSQLRSPIVETRTLYPPKSAQVVVFGPNAKRYAGFEGAEDITIKGVGAGKTWQFVDPGLQMSVKRRTLKWMLTGKGNEFTYVGKGLNYPKPVPAFVVRGSTGEMLLEEFNPAVMKLPKKQFNIFDPKYESFYPKGVPPAKLQVSDEFNVFASKSKGKGFKEFTVSRGFDLGKGEFAGVGLSKFKSPLRQRTSEVFTIGKQQPPKDIKIFGKDIPSTRISGININRPIYRKEGNLYSKYEAVVYGQPAETETILQLKLAQLQQRQVPASQLAETLKDIYKPKTDIQFVSKTKQVTIAPKVKLTQETTQVTKAKSDYVPPEWKGVYDVQQEGQAFAIAQPKSRTNFKVGTVSFQNMGSRMNIAEKEALRTRQRTLQRTIQRTKLSLLSMTRSNVRERMVTKQRQRYGMALKTKLAVATLTPTRQRTFNQVVTTKGRLLPFPFPKSGGAPTSYLNIKGKQKVGKSYFTFIRRSGKWIQLGGPAPSGIAKSKGVKAVKKTLGASFKIVATGKKVKARDIPFKVSEKIFRKPKKGGVEIKSSPIFIQRGGSEVTFVKGARLASRQERKEITALRWGKKNQIKWR